jgi:hypothetical protein
MRAAGDAGADLDGALLRLAIFAWMEGQVEVVGVKRLRVWGPQRQVQWR